MPTIAFALLFLSVSPVATEENWPQFLGPAGNGSSQQADLPLKWSETKNVRWKTAIHDRGHSSPVVWGQQIWLTTATDDGKQLFALCVDRGSGRIVHDVRVFEVEKPEPIAEINTYASPTPVVEAGRVYVHFGAYGTACLDIASGKTLWSRRDLHCNHFRGPGSSAFVYKNLLILTFDGIDVQFLAALDKRTGATVWRTNRSTDYGGADGDNRKAYSTPIVIDDGGTQLISSGAYATEAYEPETGRELWKVCYPGGFSNVARPLYGEGLLFLNTGFGRPEIWAVRPGGRGDVTKSRVVWKSKAKNLPAKPSEVLSGGLLFCVNDNGVASCLDAASGADGVAGANPRLLLRLPCGITRPDLLLRSGRQDDGRCRRSHIEDSCRQPAGRRLHGLAGGDGQGPHSTHADAPLPDRAVRTARQGTAPDRLGQF